MSRRQAAGFTQGSGRYFAAMFRCLAALMILATSPPLVLAGEAGDWLSRLQQGDASYLSLAATADQVAIGGPAGVVLIDSLSGTVRMRWPEPVDRVWIDESGALWALPAETDRFSLLKWARGAVAPEDLSLEASGRAGVTLWHSEAPISDTGSEPPVLKDSLGPVQDGHGGLWRVASEAGSVWRAEAGVWRQTGSAPAAIGSPLELRGDPRDGALWLLGTSGVARIESDGSSRVLFSETVRDLMPAWLLVLLAFMPALALALPVGGALAFGSWWRGVRAWSLLDGALALVLFLGGQLVVGVALWAVGLKLLNTWMIAGSFAGGSAASLVFLAWRLRAQALTWSQIGLHRSPWLSELSWGVGAAAAAWMVLPLLTWICRSLSIPRFLYEQSLGQTLDPDGPLETLALALAIVVVAPLTEEILFRGYALRAISKRWGRWPALLITTTVFGVAHGEGALLTGALGLIFAWVALRRETIWPTIVAHALINGVSLTLLLSGAAQ